MARINYNSPPFTVNLPYYENGVASLVTPTVGVSLDPVDTPLYLQFSSELFPIGANKFQMVFGFFETNTTALNDTGKKYFNPVPSDTIEIDGNLFLCKDIPVNANEFFSVQTLTSNPQNTVEQELAIRSLATCLSFNTFLGLRYNIEVIDARTLGFTNETLDNQFIPQPKLNDPLWAIKITAKLFGPIYNLNLYDAGLNPSGKFNANLVNYNTGNFSPSYNEFSTYGNQAIGNDNTANTFIFADARNRGEYLEGNGYGVFLEIWIVDEDYYNAEWGRVFNTVPKYKKVAALTQDWNSSNLFIFEISNYLRPYIKVPFPEFNGTFTSITHYQTSLPPYIKQGVLPYFCIYGEYFNGGFDKPAFIASPGGIDVGVFLPTDLAINGDDIEDTNLKYFTAGQTENRWACRGAYPENINPASNNRYWLAKTAPNGIDIETNDQYFVVNLTNQPKIKLRRRINAPEYMWFYLHNDEYVSSNRYYRIRYTYFMSDNLTVVTNVITVTGLEAHSGLYIVDLNLYNTQQLNVDLNFVENDESLRCVRILAFLEWSEDNSLWIRYTDSFTYEIDMNTEYNNVLGQGYGDVTTTYAKLYWRNPHGVFDQFEFEFRESYEFKTKETTFNSIAKFDYSPNYGRNKAVINKLEIDSELFYVIHSGWVNREHYLWLKELIESNEVYCANGFYIDSKSGLFYFINDIARPEAIVITDYEWSLNEKDDLFNLKITYKPAFYSNNIKI